MKIVLKKANKIRAINDKKHAYNQTADRLSYIETLCYLSKNYPEGLEVETDFLFDDQYNTINYDVPDRKSVV